MSSSSVRPGLPCQRVPPGPSVAGRAAVVHQHDGEPVVDARLDYRREGVAVVGGRPAVDQEERRVRPRTSRLGDEAEGRHRQVSVSDAAGAARRPAARAAPARRTCTHEADLGVRSVVHWYQISPSGRAAAAETVPARASGCASAPRSDVERYSSSAAACSWLRSSARPSGYQSASTSPGRSSSSCSVLVRHGVTRSAAGACPGARGGRGAARRRGPAKPSAQRPQARAVPESPSARALEVDDAQRRVAGCRRARSGGSRAASRRPIARPATPARRAGRSAAAGRRRAARRWTRCPRPPDR